MAPSASDHWRQTDAIRACKGIEVGGVGGPIDCACEHRCRDRKSRRDSTATNGCGIWFGGPWHRQSNPMKTLRFSQLSPSRQALVRLCQEVNYGQILDLQVRDSEPLWDPGPTVLSEFKLDI